MAPPRFLSLLALLYLLPTTVSASLPKPGTHSLSLLYAGQTRQFIVHVPRSYAATRPTPLVLSFHGGGGNMRIQAEDRFYGHISQAEAAGFIAVFPNGYSRFPGGRLATWNAGNCCAAARDQQSDDVGFVRALIQHLHGQLNIDRSRIFADGMSNGAMMAYRLACDMPETFRAIAAVAGTDNTRQCAPGRGVSVLHIHARDDQMVLFNGGSGRDSPQVADFVSVPASIAKWVGLNACQATPRRVLELPGAYCEAYSGCRDGAEVRLCVSENGGHAWPGGVKPRGGQASTSPFKATEMAWDFFSRQ